MADHPMQLPQPGPEHQSLARFAGKWRAEVKLFFVPGAPPQVSTGTMVNTLVLNGLFLHQDYTDDAGQYFGKGFWGYDQVGKRYEGLWLDVMMSGFQSERGQHDPKSDTYRMEGAMLHPQTGQPIRKVSVIAVHGANEHSVTQFIEFQPGQEMKTMEIRYTRA